MGAYYFLGDLWLFSPETGTRMFSLHFVPRWRDQATEGEKNAYSYLTWKERCTESLIPDSVQTL